VAGGVAGAGLLLARSFLRSERDRPDPAANDEFSALDDLVHHTVTTDDGASLHVVERGRVDGRPLLFVHGVTLSTEVWRYQLRDLAGEFRVLALDQRGHGRSRAGSLGYSLERLGADIAALVETLDLRSLIIIGHSMGGFATLRFAIDHPAFLGSRVAGLVLVNTSAGQVLTPVGGARASKLASRVVGSVIRQVGRRRAVTEDVGYLGARFILGKEASPTYVRLTHQMYENTPPETVVGSIMGFLDMDMHADLAAIDIPVVVAAGDRDLLTPVRAARRIADRLPGARLEVFPDAGHMLMLERHQEFNDLIEEFAISLKFVPLVVD
jgi:non-heme chloroperoxidase